MTVLFDVGRPRPKSNDPSILAAAMKEFLPSVLKWLEDKGETMPESEIQDVQEQLEEALTPFNSDGYERARELERTGWSPDSELVEILDGWDGALYSAHYKAERQWVIDYGIKPQLSAGQRVKAKHGDEIIEGTIKDVQNATAHYSIDVGHKNSWPLVRYEDVLDPAPTELLEA
jgi:hypothetical protein